MEERINQHGADIEALRVDIKLIRDTLADMKRELHAIYLAVYSDMKKKSEHTY